LRSPQQHLSEWPLSMGHRQPDYLFGLRPARLPCR